MPLLREYNLCDFCRQKRTKYTTSISFDNWIPCQLNTLYFKSYNLNWIHRLQIDLLFDWHLAKETLALSSIALSFVSKYLLNTSDKQQIHFHWIAWFQSSLCETLLSFGLQFHGGVQIHRHRSRTQHELTFDARIERSVIYLIKNAFNVQRARYVWVCD